MAFRGFKDMDLVKQVHIFGLSNMHIYGSNISLISLFSLIFNYAKPRIVCKGKCQVRAQELLQSQKRDRFCRRLAKNQHKDTNFRINHEGILVTHSIIGDIYPKMKIDPKRFLHLFSKMFQIKAEIKVWIQKVELLFVPLWIYCNQIAC